MMVNSDSPDCCTVRLSTAFVIQPNTESVVTGLIHQQAWCNKHSVALAESFDSFIQQTGIMVSNAVINTTEPTVSLTCANLTDKPINLKMGTPIATLQPIERVVCINRPKQNSSCCYEEKSLTDLPEHLQDMASRAIEGLEPDQSKHICGMIYANMDVFLSPDGTLGQTHLVKHSINTGNSRPIRARPYKPAIRQIHIIEEQIDDMLKAEQIVPSDSPWASPVVLVIKKDGTPRFCVDYRALNNVAIKDSYPIPNIHDCIDTLSGARWFSTLDLASGYWQCEVAEEDQSKTAFITHRGLF